MGHVNYFKYFCIESTFFFRLLFLLQIEYKCTISLILINKQINISASRRASMVFCIFFFSLLFITTNRHLAIWLWNWINDVHGMRYVYIYDICVCLCLSKNGTHSWHTVLFVTIFAYHWIIELILFINWCVNATKTRQQSSIERKLKFVENVLINANRFRIFIWWMFGLFISLCL